MMIFREGSVYFVNSKSSARTLLPFKLYSALFTHNVEFVTLTAQ